MSLFILDSSWTPFSGFPEFAATSRSLTGSRSAKADRRSQPGPVRWWEVLGRRRRVPVARHVGGGVDRAPAALGDLAPAGRNRGRALKYTP